MKKILVITPCPQNGLPTQGFIIANRLRESGVSICILSKAQSSFMRFLDMVVRGFLLVPFHNIVFINVYGERAFVYESFLILYSHFLKKINIVFLHSGLMPDFVKRWPRLAKIVLVRSDLVLAPNGYLQEVLTELGLRIDGTIPNFIDLGQYKFRKRAILKPRFLYLRGFWSIYNPEMALRAFSLIQKKHPNASLTMVGREGDCSDICRKLVLELKLSHVNFVGLIKKIELIELANDHDIHLHTNRVENMPVSIIEMWACGLPIVGTNVGGMPYLIHHEIDGILVESDNFSEMADSCIRLLADSDLACRLSSNGRRRAGEFTWEAVRPLWMKALAES